MKLKITEDMVQAAIAASTWPQQDIDMRRMLKAAIEAADIHDVLDELVTGMEVSVDVSTDEETAHHRYFGKVDIVQENPASKHGLILLVQNSEPNFK